MKLVNFNEKFHYEKIKSVLKELFTNHCFRRMQI